MAIEGMSCGHCVSRVAKALSQLPGVSLEQVEVGSAKLNYDPARVGPERIVQAVDELGYKVRVPA